MKPIKLLDSAFLHAETSVTTMHVGALFVLEPPRGGARKSFYRRLRSVVASRLDASEVFTRRLASLPLALANPFWVATGEVDLDYHLRRSVLPRPGSRRQLEYRVAQLHEPLLDRSRPLWEMHVIEGLADGQVALYVKVHHAGLDGHSAQLFLQAFVDAAPGLPAAARRARNPQPAGEAPGSLLLAGARHQLAEIRHLPARIAELASAAARLVRAQDGTAPATPRTPFNEVISARRGFATTELPLAAVREVATRARVTVNDLVLDLSAGALRHWLLQRGLLPAESLFAGVPASVRTQDNTEYAIQVTFIPVNLHTGVADPLGRLAAIHQSADVAKQSVDSYKSLIPVDAPSIGLPWLLAGASRLVSHPDVADRVPLPFNVIVSNVPGPATQIHVAGARVLTYLPISIVYHGVGVNISVSSYDSRLFVGITSCADLMADVDQLATFMTGEFAALQAALERPTRTDRGGKTASSKSRRPARSRVPTPGSRKAR